MANKAKTYTVNEVAEILGIGRNGAYEAVKSRQIPSIRIGKRILVPKVALDQMLSGGAGNEELPDSAEAIPVR